MKLKTLFQSLSLAAIALLSTTQSFAQSPSQKYGLQLYSVREEMAIDPRATIKEVADMGYDYVEANWKDGLIYGLKPQDFKNEVEKNGLDLYSLMLFHPWEEGKMDELLGWWDNTLREIKSIGCQYAIYSWIETEDCRAHYKEYSTYLNNIADLANSIGIVFAFHNHQAEFQEVDGKLIIDYFIENASENLEFQFDIYWAYLIGMKPEYFVREHKDIIMGLHLKDEAYLGSTNNFNYSAIIEAARPGALCLVEVESYGEYAPMEAVKESLKYLKK